VGKLQNAGLQPIIIVGGATSEIGDPTWKSTERVMLGREVIRSNAESILRKLRTLVKFVEPGDGSDDATNVAKLLNNSDWLSKINYMEFLRDFGSLFSVNKMLTMDSVSARLQKQHHISFLEFNYMLLQAYDFLHLFENHGCALQIGGADQWSNMIFGVDLIRRKTGKQAFGLSMPLLTTSSGKKMGKTENGAIWLDSELTNPFDFWQYWRNVDDNDVTKLLKLFTDIELEEIDAVGELVGTARINDWKIRLADEITSFVHNDADSDYPTFAIPNPVKIDEALVLAKLSDSKSAARRLIDGKGIKVDGNVVLDGRYVVAKNAVITAGKKRFVRIVVGRNA
jgi:tyrosyl-tRNA synthetase